MNVEFLEYAAHIGLCAFFDTAIGSINGFATKLRLGVDGITLSIISKKIGYSQEKALLNELKSKNLSEEYMIKRYTFKENRLEILFYGEELTGREIDNFIEWFYPCLEQNSIEKTKICVYCGEILEENTQQQLFGVTYDVHPECVSKLQEALTIHKYDEVEEKYKLLRYSMGTLGAFAGAIVSACIVAYLIMRGTYNYYLGIMITLLVEMGYSTLKGRRGLFKLLILVVCVVFASIAGVFFGEYLSVIHVLKEEGIQDIGYWKAWKTTKATFINDPDGFAVSIKVIKKSLLYSGIGFLITIRGILANDDKADMLAKILRTRRGRNNNKNTAQKEK